MIQKTQLNAAPRLLQEFLSHLQRYNDNIEHTKLNIIKAADTSSMLLKLSPRHIEIMLKLIISILNHKELSIFAGEQKENLEVQHSSVDWKISMTSKIMYNLRRAGVFVENICDDYGAAH